MTESIVRFDKVNKWYGNDFHVLRDIDLDVAKGERIVICGPSGSGKSTLIRCVNALEEYQQGLVTVDGIALIYFACCFAMSRYSQWLETRLGRWTRR